MRLKGGQTHVQIPHRNCRPNDLLGSPQTLSHRVRTEGTVVNWRMSTGDGGYVSFQRIGIPIQKDRAEEFEGHRYRGHSGIEIPFTTPASEGASPGVLNLVHGGALCGQQNADNWR